MKRALAWAGVALMALSLLWLELLPALPHSRLTHPNEKQGGPVSLVIIDAGHGGKDSGTMRNDILEKDLALDVARRLERLTQARGFATLMTRRGDESISLANRAAAANRERDCIFVSIHFDEGARAEATGVQTFYAVRQIPRTIGLPSWLPFLQPVVVAPNNLESQSLAGFVQESLVAGTRAFDRGTHAEQFYVVANVRHPAVLVEGGFLTNNDDLTKLATNEYREQLAGAIAEGLVRYRAVASERSLNLAVVHDSSE